MDTAQWPQEIGVVKGSREDEMSPNINTCSKAMVERKVRPEKEQALNCPRCNSNNTKFCYYNNYSLTQPRYFCKTCRRYWTEGGSLRNVPVGGGSRKNKRSTISSSSSSSLKLPDLNPPNLSHLSSQNSKTHQGQDLNLGCFPQEHHGVSQQFLKLPKIENHHMTCSSSSSTATWQVSALELLKTGIATSSTTHGLNNTFVSSTSTLPMLNSNTLYTPVFPLQEFKPNLNFCVDGLGTRFQENGGRVMFPFGSLKDQFPSTEVDQNKGPGNYTGQYWNGNGMFGGR